MENKNYLKNQQDLPILDAIRVGNMKYIDNSIQSKGLDPNYSLKFKKMIYGSMSFNVNFIAEYEINLLMLSILYSNGPMFEFLVSRGADVNKTTSLNTYFTSHQLTTLEIAVVMRNLDMLKLLVKFQINIPYLKNVGYFRDLCHGNPRTDILPYFNNVEIEENMKKNGTLKNEIRVILYLLDTFGYLGSIPEYFSDPLDTLIKRIFNFTNIIPMEENTEIIITELFKLIFRRGYQITVNIDELITKTAEIINNSPRYKENSKKLVEKFKYYKEKYIHQMISEQVDSKVNDELKQFYNSKEFVEGTDKKMVFMIKSQFKK
jgi:hypothetical protein